MSCTIKYLHDCQCACGGWTWVNGCDSYDGALHCRTYCETFDGRTLSGSEIGCSVCVSHDGNGICVDKMWTWECVKHFRKTSYQLQRTFYPPSLCHTSYHSPRFWPGTRVRSIAGVVRALFWAGRRVSRRMACILPRAPWTHTPGCRARLLSEPHTPTHVLLAPARGGGSEKFA